MGLRGEGGEKGRERVRGLFKKKGKGGREGEGEGEGEGRGGRGEVEKVMMLSFGAHKFPVEDLEKWEVEEGWGVVIVREGGGEVGNERIVCVSNGWLREEGLLHVDVVAGCDCVVLKTGYGIVSEVWNFFFHYYFFISLLIRQSHYLLPGPRPFHPLPLCSPPQLPRTSISG